MNFKFNKKILISIFILVLLLIQAFIIIPRSVSAISYSNGTLILSHKEFRMNLNFISWNETSLDLESSDTNYLQDYTKSNFKIAKIIIFNDSNDNGYFEEFENNLTIHTQLNYSNFPNPNNLSIYGFNSVLGNLINCTAWNSTSNPNVTYSMYALGFESPTIYQEVNFNYLEAQFKFNLTILNWPDWSNNKLLMVMNITSSLNFNKNENSLISELFNENPGPDVDDNEYKIQANWTFFQNVTLNSSIYQKSNESISGSDGDWLINFTFNKFDNLTFNGSTIIFQLGAIQNNLLFFILFAVMLCAIIGTTVIIYYTRERKNKFLNDIG